MHISKVHIKNFRLLADLELQLEPQTTVIVGRNNTGKTSLAELFRRLLTGHAASFRLEDFSLSCHDAFWNAFVQHSNGEENDVVCQALPRIRVDLTISYAEDTATLGLLSNFIVDLDTTCTEALIVFRYQLIDGHLDSLFEDIPVAAASSPPMQKTAFFRALRDRIPTHYAAHVSAVDPADSTNTMPVDFTTLRSLVQSGFITAHRGLDDTTHKDINLLGKILESLLYAAMSDSADAADRALAQTIGDSVKAIQDSVDAGFNQTLQGLLPTFSLFGYPGLQDPHLITQTDLDAERLLANNTRVQYEGANGIHLPEAYNGLGVRNLVFILLRLYELFKSFRTLTDSPAVHLVFIEEPEVHLHPQMQEVFIGQLARLATAFSQGSPGSIPWPVQFVVTTHSSHIANRAPFDAMRYMSVSKHGRERLTCAKDLRVGLHGTPPENRDFLHKYMTLTRCDLLFADKAIFVEGTSERLLLPTMIEKVDGGRPVGARLSSQYISVVEIGGAYAHIFSDLVEFLALPTLIITDLDAVKDNGSGRYVACRVSEGSRTSNGCIKDWFGDAAISPTALTAKAEGDKLRGVRRLAYQVPEAPGRPCGRSFEDAFILANPQLCGLSVSADGATEEGAWDMAAAVAHAKSAFALKYAIEERAWDVPRYIAEGLRWLASADLSGATSSSLGAEAPCQGQAPPAVGTAEDEHV